MDGKKTSDAQLRAQEKYDRENTVGVYLKLNLVHDRDILAKLKRVKNRQGYIKQLIRDDIERG